MAIIMDEIIVYTLDCCPNCERLKEYLSQHAVPFAVVDLGDPDTQVDLMYQAREPIQEAPVLQTPRGLFLSRDIFSNGEVRPGLIPGV